MVVPNAFPKDPNPAIPSVAGQEGLNLNNPGIFRLGVIMHPSVLSIISYVPNKLRLTKSEKYVVNEVTLTLPDSNPFEDVKPCGDLNRKCECLQNNCLGSSNSNSNSTGKSGRTKSFPPKVKRYAGLFLAILSSMMFSLTGLIAKLLPHHHPLTLASWMFLITFILAVPLNLYKYVFTCVHSKKSQNCQRIRNIEPVKVIDILDSAGTGTVHLQTSNWLTSRLKKFAIGKFQERKRTIRLIILCMARSCAGCSGMVLYFYSLTYLKIGDALVIVCSTPVFVSIIGYIFLGEACGILPVITIIMSMCGVITICRPPILTGSESFETDVMVGAGLAFSSMLCIAVAIVTMRSLQEMYHGLINLIFAGWGTLQTMMVALILGVLAGPQDWQDGLLMASTGVLFFIGQTFLTLALKFEEAGPVALVRTSEVVFAFVWQFVFLHQSPDLFSISGAALILAGIFLIISRKWIASMPEHTPTRKMFGVLLR